VERGEHRVRAALEMLGRGGGGGASVPARLGSGGKTEERGQKGTQGVQRILHRYAFLKGKGEIHGRNTVRFGVLQPLKWVEQKKSGQAEGAGREGELRRC